jgi:hypothetical protein
MPEEVNIIASLASQAPGVAGVIIVVLLFLRSIEKRDQLFVDWMSRVTERLTALERMLIEHDTASKARGDTLERIERKMNDGQRKPRKVNRNL